MVQLDRRPLEAPAAELPPRCRELAAQCGVRVARISVRNQRSRWGACSARGVITRTTSVLAIPFSPASSGLSSTKSSGCSSANHGSQRLITPER